MDYLVNLDMAYYDDFLNNVANDRCESNLCTDCVRGKDILTKDDCIRCNGTGLDPYKTKIFKDKRLYGSLTIDAEFEVIEPLLICYKNNKEEYYFDLDINVDFPPIQ